MTLEVEIFAIIGECTPDWWLSQLLHLFFCSQFSGWFLLRLRRLDDSLLEGWHFLVLQNTSTFGLLTLALSHLVASLWVFGLALRFASRTMRFKAALTSATPLIGCSIRSLLPLHASLG